MRTTNVGNDVPLSSVKVNQSAKTGRFQSDGIGKGRMTGSRDAHDDELFLKDECSIIDVSSPIAPLSFDSLPRNAKLALDVKRRPDNSNNNSIGSESKQTTMNEKTALLFNKK